MGFSFEPQPHAEAIALLAGKPVVSRRVFDQLLPELRARVFTITGIEAASTLQRARDILAKLPAGQTWAETKAELLAEISPFFADESGAAPDSAGGAPALPEAERRAEILLRVHGYQAFSAASWRAQHEDEDTTHLQYVHGHAEVPTPSHLALDGLVLPKDDPFWKTHYGPWGHPGCVCWARGINPDQLEEIQSADAARNPDDKLVMEGAAKRKLNEGQLVRDGKAYNVAPPDDPKKFQWHPEDLRVPLDKLEARYDPDVFNTFKQFAQNTELNRSNAETQSEEPFTLWDWLTRKKKLRR